MTDPADDDPASIEYGNKTADMLGMDRLAYWQRRAQLTERHEDRLHDEVAEAVELLREARNALEWRHEDNLYERIHAFLAKVEGA